MAKIRIRKSEEQKKEERLREISNNAPLLIEELMEKQENLEERLEEIEQRLREE